MAPNEDRPPDADPPAEIARRFARGDAAATRRVRRRVRRILSFRGYGIPSEDRRDLEQAILTQLWQAANRAGFDRGGFWGLVEVVTSRRCIDWRRTRRAEAPLELVAEVSDHGANPLAGVLRRERSELVHAALAELPESCRELIRLHAGGDRTYREIARLLGSSEGALRVQMHRCIRRASRILARLIESEPPRPL